MYKPKKELGQNFLLEHDVIEEMILALNLSTGDEVVEIGAGLGALTQMLSDKIFHSEIILHAIEIDERYAAKLNTMFLENLNLNVVHSDVLHWLPTFVPKGNYKILGSLPYYITSPILHSIIRQNFLPEICVLLIQKEVAEKISQVAPKSSYLSTYIHTFYDVDFLRVVPKSFFSPSPKVDGGVIKMTKKPIIPIAHEDILSYEGFLHKGYSKPRKMINKIFSKDFLKTLRTDETLRPQHLDLEKWLELYKNTKLSSQ